MANVPVPRRPVRTTSDPVLRVHLANAVTTGKKYGIDPAIILGILKVEGGTNAHGQPVAPGDGLGPPSFGQFITATGRALGVKYGDSKSEVDAIGRYLIQLGYKKDPKRAVAAYNGGPGNPQFSYAEKVMGAANGYKDVTGKKDGGGLISGWPDIGDVLGIDGPDIPNPVSEATDGLDAIGSFFGGIADAVFDPHWWLRVGLIVGGAVFMVLGVIFIGKTFIASQAGGIVKKAIPTK